MQTNFLIFLTSLVSKHSARNVETNYQRENSPMCPYGEENSSSNLFASFCADCGEHDEELEDSETNPEDLEDPKKTSKKESLEQGCQSWALGPTPGPGNFVEAKNFLGKPAENFYIFFGHNKIFFFKKQSIFFFKYGIHYAKSK